MRALTTSIPIVLGFMIAAQASAQQPPPAPPPAPAPAPAEAPPPAPPPDASGSASWSFASGFDAEATGPQGEEEEEQAAPTEDEAQRRAESLKLHNNLYGSTGLLRLSEAGSGAAGTFRLSLIMEWFDTSDFLCTADYPCGARGAGDSASHFGTTASLSITPVDFLEVYGSFRSYANHNDFGRPTLLQVLGDSVIGLKGFTPNKVADMFSFGGEAQLLLVNATGDVGLDGSGTSFRLRALASGDFNKPDKQGVPLRLHTNIGYRFDNSASVVEDVEKARGGEGSPMPITRIERFGLGINRTDFFELGLGVEGTFDYVRPFLEYTIDLPVNRQDYLCNTTKATTVAFNDGCLAMEQSFSRMPSRLTIGLRGYPILEGFAPIAAFDIGLSGTSNFIEEVAPEAPWKLYVGVGYAFDPVKPPPVIKTETVERVVQVAPPPEYVVRGKVLEEGTPNVVANAMVFVQGRADGGYVTGPEGVFVTHSLEPGAYTFTVKAEGFHDAQCTAQVSHGPLPPTGTGAAPAPEEGPDRAPVTSWPGDTAAAQPATPPPATDTLPPPAEAQPGTEGSQRINYVDISCPVKALPRTGNIVGTVRNATTNDPVAGATVELIGIEGQRLTATTDGSGGFKFDAVKPGDVQLRVESSSKDLMMRVQGASVKARDTARVELMMSPKPKQSLVTVTPTQIIIRRQVHFETNSSNIVSDSEQLLEEVADVIHRNKDIRRIEIQGHTDDRGGIQLNQGLSEQRAQAVREWLVQHGVEGNRLEAKGYGASRPIVPNVTERNRARNRRVQFVITERDKR